MSILSVIFDATDKMSDKFDKMANSGEKALEQWERAGEIGDEAFENTARAATQTAKAMDTASQSTDHWTDKIGNYDKSAMEAIYSTEELVEMGYKTADALDEEANAADEAARASEKYGEGAEEAANATEALGDILATVGVARLLHEIAAGAMECVESFQEYQTSVAKVNTLADTSVKSIDDISSEVMSLSDDVGQASSDIAEATYQAISAGLNTANSVDFVRQANELAVGGFTSATTAVDVLTTALNAYGLEASNASQIADYLITTQNLGKTTVDELANSVGKVIPIAAAYGVEMDNLSTAYAVLTANGIATAETGTYLKAMLNELGDSGSAVTAVLINETGMSFAQLTEQGYSLGDVMEILGNSVNNNAGAFNELWSSSEAGIGSLSIMNSGAERYNSVLNSMETSTGAASAAFEKMADTSAFAEQKMVNSAKNLQIAIGEDLSGVLDGVYSIGAKIMGGITSIVQKSPAVTAVIVGTTGALATLVIGVTAYTLYTKYATVATKAFTAAMNSNPIILVATAVVGLVAGIAVLASNLGEAEEKFVKLTATSEKQANKISELEKEYQRLCDAGQENSEAAIYLKYQIDSLSDSFEAGKQTLEDYIAACEQANDAWNETLDSNRDAFESISTNEGCYISLIHRLEELASQSDITVASQEEMKAIIDELNKALPGLSLSYDSVINSAGDFGVAIENMIKAQAAMERYEAAKDGMIDAYNVIYEAEQQLSDLRAQEALEIENNAKLQQQYNEVYEAYSFWINSGGRGTNPYEKSKNELKKALEESNTALDSYKTKIGETQDTLNSAQADYDTYLETISEIAGVTEDAFNEVSSAEGVIDAMAASVSSLAGAYNEAYAEAQKSFEGQFGLFDQAKADADATVANMQSALNSQLSFWETYAANLDTLKTVSADDLGVTQAQYDKLIALASEGSEEAAGLAQSMANAIKSGNEESIVKIVNTLDKIEEAKAKAASAAAEWQIDFSGKMDEIVKKAETAINDMNLSPEADTAARATMNAYAEAIRTQGATAIANAQSIASQVKAALQSASTTINIGVTGNGTTGKGYASGTDFATPGWHLVGENGPEIVEFAGGETVYPADETSRMLASMRPTPLNTNVPESLTGQKTEDVATKDRRIVVAIEGGGEINVKGDVSKETVVELLVSNLKPVLLNMIQEEVFEEGDGSYEY